METERELTFCNGTSPAGVPWAGDDPPQLRHSTPIIKKHLEASRTPDLAAIRLDSSGPRWIVCGATPNHSAGLELNPCSPSIASSPGKDQNSSNLQMLRQELQLLVTDLKDRERELNAMTAAQCRQQRSWEQDWHRMDRRRVRLEEELQKRNEMIRALTARLTAAENRESDVQKQLQEARRQLSRQQEKPQVQTGQWLQVQEENQSLSSTVSALSSQLGALQIREEELTSMLKLKDNDVSEASSHIRDLSERLQELEEALKEKRLQENQLQRDSEENRRRYRHAKQEVAQLREELQQEVTQSSSQREEIIRLKQELQLLQQNLILTEGGDSWKDELLLLARSKQERLTSELLCMKQVCANQHNDLRQLAQTEKSVHEKLHSKNQLRCRCLGRQSPSLLSVKKQRASTPDPSTPTEAARLPGCHRGDCSTRRTKVNEELSGFSLQKLLEDSQHLPDRSNISSLRCSMTPDPYVWRVAPTIQTTGGALPSSCLRHASCHPAMSPP